MLLSHEGIEVILKWTDESAKKSAKQRNTKIILLRLIADWPTSRFICKLIEDVNHRVSKVVALEQETKGHR